MTFDKVKEIIMETINVDEELITMEATLKDDLGIDSLDAMELCMAIEEAYGISIQEEAINTFDSVKKIVEYIDANVA